MILPGTNVVPELMKPAVMAWSNILPGPTIFISAITQAEIPYGVTLVPEGKRRDGLAQGNRLNRGRPGLRPETRQGALPPGPPPKAEPLESTWFGAGRGPYR